MALLSIQKKLLSAQEHLQHLLSEIACAKPVPASTVEPAAKSALATLNELQSDSAFSSGHKKSLAAMDISDSGEDSPQNAIQAAIQALALFQGNAKSVQEQGAILVPTIQAALAAIANLQRNFESNLSPEYNKHLQRGQRVAKSDFDNLPGR